MWDPEILVRIGAVAKEMNNENRQALEKGTLLSRHAPERTASTSSPIAEALAEHQLPEVSSECCSPPPVAKLQLPSPLAAQVAEAGFSRAIRMTSWRTSVEIGGFPRLGRVPVTMSGQLVSRRPNILVNETTEPIDPDDLGCIRFARHLSRNRDIA